PSSVTASAAAIPADTAAPRNTTRSSSTIAPVTSESYAGQWIGDAGHSEAAEGSRALVAKNACSPTAVSTDTPTSMPTTRATTTSAEAMPSIDSLTAPRIAAFTGPMARPTPMPHATSTGSLGCSHAGPTGSPSV